MNKSAVFSHFSHILDNMIENSLFFDTYFMDPVGIEDIEGSALDEAIPANICINFGATRGCIVDENYDYERFKIGDGVTLVNNLPFVIDFFTEEDINEICGSEIYAGSEVQF